MVVMAILEKVKVARHRLFKAWTSKQRCKVWLPIYKQKT